MFVIRHFLNEQHLKKKIQAALVFLAWDRVRAPKEGWRRLVSPPARQPQRLQRPRGSPLTAAGLRTWGGRARDRGRVTQGIHPRRQPRAPAFSPFAFLLGGALAAVCTRRAGSTLQLRRAGCSAQWQLLLQSTGSRHLGFSSCSAACAVSPQTRDRTRVSPCWQVDS